MIMAFTVTVFVRVSMLAMLQYMFNPMYADGRVYIVQHDGPMSTGDNYVVAVNASTGERVFTTSVGILTPDYPLASTPKGDVLVYSGLWKMESGTVGGAALFDCFAA